MNDFLEKLLLTVNDWLRFAESKNAVLLTVDGALLVGVLALNSFFATNIILTVLFYNSLIFLVLSISVLSISFYARLKLDWLIPDKPPTDNLLYFGNLCNFSEKKLFDAIDSRYFKGNSAPFEAIHRDLSNQIIVNSKIAMKKFRLFNAGLLLSTCALLTPPLAILFYFLVHSE